MQNKEFVHQGKGVRSVKQRQLRALKQLPANRLQAGAHRFSCVAASFDAFCQYYGYANERYARMRTHGPEWEMECRIIDVNREWESILVDLRHICQYEEIVLDGVHQVVTVERSPICNWDCMLDRAAYRMTGITYAFRIISRRLQPEAGPVFQ